MKNKIEIFRNEIWLAVLDPTIGREQSGTRPVLVLSVDDFNLGLADLIVVLPISSKDKKNYISYPSYSPRFRTLQEKLY